MVTERSFLLLQWAVKTGRIRINQIIKSGYLPGGHGAKIQHQGERFYVFKELARPEAFTAIVKDFQPQQQTIPGQTVRVGHQSNL